jgi:NAD(P)H-hydrate repair Nnr-like enzyme with NAD(P)H-hydrate dehydratase domain
LPGAALLAAAAALRAGAGKLQIATCRSIAPHLGVAYAGSAGGGYPETAEGRHRPWRTEDLVGGRQKCDAVLIGPGMMDGHR